MSVATLPPRTAAGAPRGASSPGAPASVHHDRLTGPAQLGFRPTHRTIRVLMALEEHPGANNTLVARRAGITDNAQISKLLHRLERLGLLENRGPGQTTSWAPNAWYLTARGVEAHTVTCIA